MIDIQIFVRITILFMILKSSGFRDMIFFVCLFFVFKVYFCSNEVNNSVLSDVNVEKLKFFFAGKSENLLKNSFQTHNSKVNSFFCAL